MLDRTFRLISAEVSNPLPSELQKSKVQFLKG